MSRIIRFIGDTHGLYKRYKRIIKSSSYPSIQLGDMGVGFIRYGGSNHGSFSLNPPFDAMIKGPHEFIRGNHDNPGVCKRQKLWIPDGTVRDNMMFIGGAVSIDRALRIRDYSWWADEEPSIAELLTMVDIYKITQPEIMVTHEVPEETAHIMCIEARSPKFDDGSRCRQAFQSMFEIHQPRLWLAGHWHRSFDKIINSTRFIVLNELEWADIDTETMEILDKGQG